MNLPKNILKNNPKESCSDPIVFSIELKNTTNSQELAYQQISTSK